MIRLGFCIIVVFLLLVDSSPVIAGRFDAQCPDDKASHPGDKSTVWAPGGKIALLCVESDLETTDKGGRARRLYLIKKNMLDKLPVRFPTRTDNQCEVSPQNADNSFDRTIQVFWSPDASRFAVNDHSQGPGSIRNVFLYNVSDPQHPVDVRRALASLVSKEDRSNYYLDTDVSSGIDFIKWLDSKHVRLKSYGRHVIVYEWNLAKVLKRLSSRPR